MNSEPITSEPITFEPARSESSPASSHHPRRIVIGDVHGHYGGLMELLNQVAPGEQDQVYFLGDLIDRGPDSAQVVEFVKNSPYHCIMGNHEQMMLMALPEEGHNHQAWDAWLYSGGDKTVDSYRTEGIIPREHLRWMRKLKPYLDLGDVWLVHAGMRPDRPVTEQTEAEMCWIRREFHNISKPFFADKLIIIGHTITFTFDGIDPGSLVRGQGWLDIDTGAYHAKSGWLTALDLTNRWVHQVNVLRPESRSLSLEEATDQFQPPQPPPRRAWWSPIKL